MATLLEKWGQFGEKLVKWVELDKSDRKKGNKIIGFLKQIFVLLIIAHLWIFFSNCYGILMLYFPEVTGYIFLLSIVSPWFIIGFYPICFFIDAVTSKYYSQRLLKTGLFFSISCLIISFLTFPFTSDGPIIPTSSFIKNKLITDKTKFPLSHPEGIAVDSTGRIYLALQTYSRVQAYSNTGEFINGWDINAGEGAFEIWVEDDKIHVLTARTDRHDIFTPEGKLIKHEKVVSFEMDMSLSKNADRLITHDAQENIYNIRSPLWKPEILKTMNNETAVLIQDPIYVWIHHSPQPVWLIGLISLLESALFYGLIKIQSR